MASILLFVDIRLNPQMQSILLGAVIIVVLGVVDDIMALPAKLKFVVQIVAALIPALNGVSIQALSNPNIFSPNAYWVLNWLSVPVTVLWIVGITNAVNLIDGLDGLANGVSAISAATVLVIALICSEAQVEVDDVDAVTLHIDVFGHLGVPAAGLVTEVDTGFQQLLHGYYCHVGGSSFILLLPPGASTRRDQAFATWSPVRSPCVMRGYYTKCPRTLQAFSLSFEKIF